MSQAHRTRQALAEALKRLMQTTPLDKITVVTLVQECGINRQTFYYHFQNIYDLLGWIYQDEALRLISDCRTYETWQEAFLRILRYIRKNASFCRNVLRYVTRDEIDRFLYRMTIKGLIDVVNEIAGESPLSEKRRRFIANFYCYAFIGIVNHWVVEGMHEEPESIIHDIKGLIEGDVRRIMARCA